MRLRRDAAVVTCQTVQSALNAVWGVTRHLGGETPKENPGPGDRYDEIKPLMLPD